MKIAFWKYSPYEWAIWQLLSLANINYHTNRQTFWKQSHHASRWSNCIYIKTILILPSILQRTDFEFIEYTDTVLFASFYRNAYRKIKEIGLPKQACRCFYFRRWEDIYKPKNLFHKKWEKNRFRNSILPSYGRFLSEWTSKREKWIEVTAKKQINWLRF